MTQQREFRRPRVVISRCIDFDACRYDGQVIRASLREQLEPHVDFVPICPELEIGLGVPRDPVRVVGDGRIVQPSSGRDLTAAMTAWSQAWLDELDPVDGFILKAKSPSCGVGDVGLYANSTDETPIGVASGLFAESVAKRFPDAVIASESELVDGTRRETFLRAVRKHAHRRLGTGNE